MQKIVKSVFALSFILTVFFAGCKETPKEVFVVAKDTKKMLETAQAIESGKKINEISMEPSHYTYSFSNESGTLRISVDAPVQIPEVKVLPIITIQDCGFEQSLVSKIFKFIYPHEQPYLVENPVQTKEDLDELLRMYQKMLNEKDFDFLEEDEILDLISVIEENYDSAPVEADVPAPKKTNGKMTMVDDGTTTYYQLSCQLPNDAKLEANSLFIRSYGTDGINSDLSKYEHLAGMNSKLLYYKPIETDYPLDKEIQLDYMSSVPEEYTDDLLVDFITAKEYCEDFFRAIGYSNSFELGHMSLIGNSEGKYGFSFIYSRKIGGCPSALITLDSGYGTFDPYALPWGYECLQILVDDTGIIQINWANPIKENGVLVENANILEFREIEPTFEKMVKTYYEAQVDYGGTALFPAELEVNVSSIKLQLLRIREKDNQGRVGLAVPAWIFYGHIKRAEQINGGTYYLYDSVGDTSMEYPAGPIIVMAINAIDRSVIDLGNGY